MVNLVQQTPIILPGPGLKTKPRGNFLEGEYSYATNVTCDQDGAIVPRPVIKNVPLLEHPIIAGSSTEVSTLGPDAILRPLQYVGSLGEYAVISTISHINISSADLTRRCKFNVADMYGGTETLEAYQYYNNGHYLVTVQKPIVTTDVTNTIIYVNNRITVTNIAGVAGESLTPRIFDRAYSSGTMPSVVVANVEYKFTNAPLTDNFGTFDLKNIFMHKERMWICTSDTLYFSKAGNPMLWDVGNTGGFYVFKDQDIKFALSFKNTIYIFTDSSIYYLNYSIDPNNLNDATLVKISDSLGADYACVHEDQIFFIKNDFLYTVSTNTITRVRSLDLKLDLTNNSRIKLVPYRNYIMMLNQVAVPLRKTVPASIYQPAVGYLRSYQNPNNDVYMLNMDTDFLSKVEYDDFYKNLGLGIVTRTNVAMSSISDMLIPPTENSNTNYGTLLILNACMNSTYTPSGAGDSFTPSYYGRSSFMEGSSNPVSRNGDTVRAFTDGSSAVVPLIFQQPYLRLEMTGYVPDGNTFSVKKFRSLMVEGRFPNRSDVPLHIMFSYDDKPFVFTQVIDPTTIPMFSVGLINSPTSFRFGLNQRSRSFSIRIFCSVTNLGFDYDDDLDWMISNMSLLWQPTTRAPKYSANNTLDSASTYN